MERPKNIYMRELPSRFVGVLSLTLIFLASAGITIAYLSSSQQASATSVGQTASAAISAATSTPDPFAGMVLNAQSAYVEDLATGQVLYSLNPEAQLPLASLTKIAMALVVSEMLPPDQLITLPHNAVAPGSTVLLTKGEVLSVHDLLDYTLVVSSNDGADILAGAANDALHAKYPDSPADATTVWRMNDLVQGLGLTHTYYLSDNGLDISTTQASAFGSAHDMAELFAYAASTSPELFAATTQSEISVVPLSGASTTAYNTDDDVHTIPGLILSKTGYTDLAGGNLGVVFNVGPSHPVVIIVLHSTYDGRFSDMQKLVTAALTAVGEGK